MVGLEKGRVVVGAIPTVAPYSLPERVASFSRKYPTVQISVVEENHSRAARTPVGQHRHGPARARRSLRLPRIVPRSSVSGLPGDHRSARRPQASLRDVEDDALLLLKEGHCLRETT